jgi:hypothetical protein
VSQQVYDVICYCCMLTELAASLIARFPATGREHCRYFKNSILCYTVNINLIMQMLKTSFTSLFVEGFGSDHKACEGELHETTHKNVDKQLFPICRCTWQFIHNVLVLQYFCVFFLPIYLFFRYLLLEFYCCHIAQSVSDHTV